MYSSNSITLKKYSKALHGTINLPASKSISNRLLIINALSHDKVIINNLSQANDTQILKRRILSDSKILDVGDAGTAMRFITALKALTTKEVVIQGTARMHERPIESLVAALTTLGAEIEYLDKKGYPPIKLNGFNQKSREVTVPGNISSQFLSALLLIAPSLSLGIRMEISGKIMSKPYMLMTINLLQKCGIEVNMEDKVVDVKNQEFQPTMISVEADWSSASYWFAFAALCPGTDILLPGLLEDSMQGDSKIIDIAESWGVTSEFSPVGLRLTHSPKITDEQVIDFSDTPDLAQTVAVAHALLGIRGVYTGLESLKIKETDRIKALQNELIKIGALLSQENGKWILEPGGEFPENVSINTYYDHRMAMAFSVLCTKMNVTIENRDVVNKSYGSFWEDIKSVDIDLM